MSEKGYQKGSEKKKVIVDGKAVKRGLRRE